MQLSCFNLSLIDYKQNSEGVLLFDPDVVNRNPGVQASLLESSSLLDPHALPEPRNRQSPAEESSLLGIHSIPDPSARKEHLHSWALG